MESLLFIIDACAIVAVVFFSLKNDLRPPGTPQVGLFRYDEEPVARSRAKPRWRERTGRR